VKVYGFPLKVKANQYWLSACMGTLKKALAKSITEKNLEEPGKE